MLQSARCAGLHFRPAGTGDGLRRTLASGFDERRKGELLGWWP